ncbi:putative sulfate transporter [Golovinomyces cichoracearum]|uniref:Putative sulfate transporter n=1 Tax=Golovinomyces cichoracearum TaxID=62708 RepID=A0A420I7Z8_9PEZI|nr:putative sulfate transporter [Golovinomyces cichoracearum]
MSKPSSKRSSPPTSPRILSNSYTPSAPSGLRQSQVISYSSDSIHSPVDTIEQSKSSSSPEKSQGDHDITRDSSSIRDKTFGSKVLEDDQFESSSDDQETSSLLSNDKHDPCANSSSAGPRKYKLRPKNFQRSWSLRSSKSESDESIKDSYSRSTSADRRIKPRHGGLFSSRASKDKVGALKKKSKTRYLAEQHGIANTKSMYLTYYIPILAWIGQYRWSYVKGDLTAAITMASFYVPMALSYAANLGHIPPINGLYSFVFNPLVYAIFGSSPQMIVGPEAPGSLLVGNIVRSFIDSGDIPDDDTSSHAIISGVVVGLAGAFVLIAGLCRLGFLDSVLSKPFLRGFISAIGIVIAVDQLIPEMGLADLADSMGDVSHGSTTSKIRFIIRNTDKASGITSAVAGVSFLCIMCFRELKKLLQPRYPIAVCIPDRFIVVVLSIALTWKLRWDLKGLEILGDVKSSPGSTFPFHWPFTLSNTKVIKESMGTAFSIALLGFFESSIAAKSLSTEEKKGGLQGITLSPNRELVALGLSNLVGGSFCALPAFGGYGRSKVNASTGGKTPMSSVFLSIITAISTLYLLPLFYYLPKAVLSSMITVVAWSLIEEAPKDILFFIKVRGFAELGLMMIILVVTIFYSLTMGMTIGIGLSILSVIKHSTRSRIQILGRIPGTDRFENAEDNLDRLEFIEGCLIVKIPEPLTFANTGQLRSRLRRLEIYGSTDVHPALPRVRGPEHNKNIIFDIHGVTELDASGAQVLEEIVRAYRDRGVRVIFSRCPAEGTAVFELFRNSGIIDICGGTAFFVRDVHEALRITEMEDIAIGATYTP